MPADYTPLTEIAGTGVTEEGRRMVVTRYELAASYAPDCDVLEVGAGAGFALGWFARKAKRVVGTDFTPRLVQEARQTYGSRIPLAVSDAQQLPFRDQSFDLVVFYEALYYVPDPEEFFREAYRVLRTGGRVLVCIANRHRPGFVRSPYSHSYHDGDELAALLRKHGFGHIDVHVAFPAEPLNLAQRVVLVGFGLADKVRLIPRTLKGRARFKRLLYGELMTMPRELEPGIVESEPLSMWRTQEKANWKVIYATGTRE